MSQSKTVNILTKDAIPQFSLLLVCPNSMNLMLCFIKAAMLHSPSSEKEQRSLAAPREAGHPSIPHRHSSPPGPVFLCLCFLREVLCLEEVRGRNSVVFITNTLVLGAFG